MKRFLLWLARPFLRWGTTDKLVAIIDSNGSIYMEGRIVGIRVSLGSDPEIDVVPLGGSIHDCRTLKIYGGLRWNCVTKHFELERANAVESSRKRLPDCDVESRDDHPGNRTPDGETPEHSESETQASGPASAPDRGPHGESESRFRPGHDADIPSESGSRWADSPGSDKVSGPAGHQRAMIRLGVNEAIPLGTLIGVSPDQNLHIYHVTEYSWNLPYGSVIWGHPITIDWIRGGIQNQVIH